MKLQGPPGWRLQRSIFQGKAGAHLGLKLYFCVEVLFFDIALLCGQPGENYEVG